MRLALGVCVVCLAASLASSARAEMPAGEYTISLGEDDGLFFPSGAIDNGCPTTRDGVLCVSGNIATDASGVVTGTAALTLEGVIDLDLALVLDGRLAGSTFAPKALIDFSAAGTASIEDPNQPTDPNAPRNPPLVFETDGGGRMKCALDPEAPDVLSCAGKAKLCVFDDMGKKLGCDRLPFTTPLEFVRTPFDIHLALATDAKNAVSGDAQVLIDAAPIFAYAARGKYKPTTDAATLKLASADPSVKSKIALKQVQLAGGGAGDGLVLFKVAGQTGAVLLAPLTFAGHGTCIRGAFCDVNQDTAALFPTPTTSPLSDTLWFGILGAASRTGP